MTHEEEKWFQDMTEDERKKVLSERVKRRVELLKGMSKEERDRMLGYYEDKAIFQNRLWITLERLRSKGMI